MKISSSELILLVAVEDDRMWSFEFSETGHQFSMDSVSKCFSSLKHIKRK